MKKFFLFVFFLVCGIAYAHSHLTSDMVLDFAQQKANPAWTPRVEYYVGYYDFYQGRDADAVSAFQQLLSDYPDTAYKPQATFHMGEAYQDERMSDKALQQYQSYLDDNPDGEFSDLAKNKISVIRNGG